MNIAINNLKFTQNLKKPSAEKNSTNPILSQPNSCANISSYSYRPNFTGKKAEQAPAFGKMSVEQVIDLLNQKTEKIDKSLLHIATKANEAFNFRDLKEYIIVLLTFTDIGKDKQEELLQREINLVNNPKCHRTNQNPLALINACYGGEDVLFNIDVFETVEKIVSSPKIKDGNDFWNLTSWCTLPDTETSFNKDLLTKANILLNHPKTENSTDIENIKELMQILREDEKQQQDKIFDLVLNSLEKPNIKSIVDVVIILSACQKSDTQKVDTDLAEEALKLCDTESPMYSSWVYYCKTHSKDKYPNIAETLDKDRKLFPESRNFMPNLLNCSLDENKDFDIERYNNLIDIAKHPIFKDNADNLIGLYKTFSDTENGESPCIDNDALTFVNKFMENLKPTEDSETIQGLGELSKFYTDEYGLFDKESATEALKLYKIPEVKDCVDLHNLVAMSSDENGLDNEKVKKIIELSHIQLNKLHSLDVTDASKCFDMKLDKEKILSSVDNFIKLKENAHKNKELLSRFYEPVSDEEIDTTFDIILPEIISTMDIMGSGPINYKFSDKLDGVKSFVEQISSLSQLLPDKELEKLKQKLSEKSIEPQDKASRALAILALAKSEAENEKINQFIDLIKPNKASQEQMDLVAKIFSSEKPFEKKSQEFLKSFNLENNEKTKSFLQKNRELLDRTPVTKKALEALDRVISNEVVRKENDKAWDKAIYNEFTNIYNFKNPEAVKKTLNISKSPYIQNVVFNENEDFVAKFEEFTSHFTNPKKSVKETLNGLAQNIATKKLFKENNLNYDKWVQYNPQSYIDFTNAGKTLRIQKTDMDNLSHSMFLGNHAGACTAIGGSRQTDHFALSYIEDKFLGAIELLDGDKSIGNTMCYFANVDGKPAMILDEIMFGNKIQDNNDLLHAIVKYAKQLTKEVAGKELPVYLPNLNIQFNLEKEYKKQEHEVQIIGNSKNEPLYITSLFEGNNQNYVIPENDKVKTELYQV